MVLPERIDVFSAKSVRERLLEAIALEDYTLDFKDVRILDSAGVQLLLSFVKSAGRDKVSFTNIYPEVAGVFHCLGVET